MHLATILSALAVSCAWLPAAAADADFEQVTNKNSVDHSNRATDPPEKYFRTLQPSVFILTSSILTDNNPPLLDEST